MEKFDTGKLLYEGYTGSRIQFGEKGIKLQKKYFAIGIFGFCLSISLTLIIAIRIIKGTINTKDPIVMLFALILSIMIIMLCMVGLYVLSFSVNRIYEKGIESFVHTITDYFKGYTFHLYENITKIEYGQYKDTEEKKVGEFLIIHEEQRPKAVTAFHSTSFTNDFYKQLKKALEKNCPEADWVPRKQETLPWKLK